MITDAPFQSVLDSISDGLMVIDRDMVVTYFNGAAEQLLGRTRKEVQGRHLFNEAFPQAADSIFEKQYKKALHCQKPVEFETYFGVKPYENWYRVRAYPFSEGLTIFFRVITDLKTSEKALDLASRSNAAMAQLSQAIISLSSLDDISALVLEHALSLSSSRAGLIGYVDPERGTFICPAIIGAAHLPEAGSFQPLVFDLSSPFCRLASNTETSMNIEAPGSDQWIPRPLMENSTLHRVITSPAIVNRQWLGQIVLANSPQPYTDLDLNRMERLTSLYALAIQRARTEQALQEASSALEQRVMERTAQLMATNERLRFEMNEREEAEKARLQAEEELATQRVLSLRSDRLRSLGEMAAGIAHELNQPLSGVRGLAEHLLLGQERGWAMSPEEQNGRLSLILDQADRMTHIIDHVRLFAREAGKPETQLVDPAEVVQSAVDMLDEQYRSHGINIITEFDHATEGMVKVNPFSLEEVLLNLLNNARDAVLSQEESGRHPDASAIVIRTDTNTADQPNQIEISVTDSGPGIPQNEQDKVFDPFFTTKAPQSGTGLGLSISKSIVEQFGGEIFIKSIQGSRTTVTVTLPLATQGVEGLHNPHEAAYALGGK